MHRNCSFERNKVIRLNIGCDCCALFLKLSFLDGNNCMEFFEQTNMLIDFILRKNDDDDEGAGGKSVNYCEKNID